MTDLVVAGGTVVTPDGPRLADLSVADGLVERIGPELSREGSAVIDASGLFVLPGVVDVHTHVRLSDAEHPDRFERDLRAAARGGTTTVLTFNNPGTGISERGSESLLAGLDEFRERTAGRAAVDYGLCAVVSAQQPDALDELPELIRRGVPTFKAFMVYDFAIPEHALPPLMRTAARNGGMLMLHCEDPTVIDPLVAGALRRGDVGPRHHAHTRPVEAEARATRRAIEVARRVEAPLYIVHLSCEAALEAVAEARERGEPVHAETCPQYLALTDALYDDPDDAEVIKRVISPPLRQRSDVEALWAGLREGILEVVASDHVPDRVDAEKRLPAPSFPEISNGAPGIETLLTIVYSEGVAAGRIDLGRMVEVLASAPALLFGLASKGSLEPGKDADLVLWDPSAQRTIRQADLHHSSDFTPYEGMAVRGAPATVLVGGRPIGPLRGRFLERRL